MGARVPSQSDDTNLLSEAFRRIRKLEEDARSQVLPPGYHFRMVAGHLVIIRESDGLTLTLVFT